MHTECWLETLKERDLSEDLGIDGRMDLSDMQWEGVVSIRLVRDRDQ
jgi:hypothetical protein